MNDSPYIFDATQANFAQAVLENSYHLMLRKATLKLIDYRDEQRTP
jgi:hypothetical protein